MPWVTPKVAGFICDIVAPHRNPLAKTSCMLLSYLRTKFHTHRNQLSHYLAQSNRGPKIVYAMPFHRNITSNATYFFTVCHYISYHCPDVNTVLLVSFRLTSSLVPCIVTAGCKNLKIAALKSTASNVEMGTYIGNIVT